MKFKGKKILILGANPETAGLVLKCNELGIITYVTDNNPKAYAKRFASFPYDIDATNVQELKKLIIKEKIDGVICGVAESLMPVYAKICNDLNLPCYGNDELFKLFVDKAEFKNLCRKHGVSVVDEFFLEDYSDEQLKTVRLPVVVKPVDSCSSKGISVCKTFSELKDGIAKALRFSKRKKLLIEKYMTGDEVILYYAFQDGEPSLITMCDRYTNKDQVGYAQLPTSYIFPSIHLGEYLKKHDKTVKDMFKDIGVNNGFMFIQSFIDEDGSVKFYEPGYRLNGAQEHFIVGKATGIDARECLISLALTGEESEELISEKANPRLNGYFGCKLSPLVETGRIKSIKGLEQIKEMEDVVSINPSYDEGDIVEGKGTLKQIVCRFFIVSKTLEDLKNTVDNIYKYFDVIDENDKSMLLRQFDTNILIERYSND